MLERNNDRKTFQGTDMEGRRGNVIGKNKANALGVTNGAGAMKTSISGKMEVLGIPK